GNSAVSGKPGSTGAQKSAKRQYGNCSRKINSYRGTHCLQINPFTNGTGQGLRRGNVPVSGPSSNKRILLTLYTSGNDVRSRYRDHQNPITGLWDVWRQ